MLHPNLATYVPQLQPQPLSALQFDIVCEQIKSEFLLIYPEYTAIANLQYWAGCRVSELFQPNRWKIERGAYLRVTPQKGNAERLIALEEIHIANPAHFQILQNDMARLSQSMYERGIKNATIQAGLWRQYENGFAQPSTHMFRHNRIKQMAAQGNEPQSIATWIGEKNIENLNYYLNSAYFLTE